MARSEIATRLAELSPEERAALFERSRQRKQKRVEKAQPPLLRRSRDDYSYLLSFAQQRLWFLNAFEPESPEYNVPQALLIEGVLDQGVLTEALRQVVARHETLRTVFVSEEGQPFQIVQPELAIELPFKDLSDRPVEEAWAAAMGEARADARSPFDLATGPVLRAKLFRVDDERWLLYLNVHHIAYDQWSMGIMASELAEFYRAGSEGRAPVLRTLQVQYLDFGIWQREWLSGEVLEEQLDYWRKQLAGVAPLDLPTDRPRPPVRTFSGGTLAFPLSPEVSARLRELAVEEAATLFIVLSAGFKAVLAHYTAQDDVALGTLVANRRRPEIEGLIGFFANTLVLRTDLSGDPTFRQLVHRERDAAFDAYGHQDLPFEKLVDELNPQRDMARTPLFQAMLILLNAPGEPLELPGARLAPVPLDSRTSKFELTLYMTEAEDRLAGYLEFNSDLFDGASLERLLSHFRVLLEAFTDDPGLRLSQVQLLTADERRHLIHDLNDTAAPAPAAPLPRLLAERRAATPTAVAVQVGDATLTYAQLDARANRLARHLVALGVGPEVLVGLCVERGLDMVVALLAVMKSGGAYVPLDPEYPASRLSLMLGDARAPVVVTQEALIEKLPQTSARILALDRDAAAIAAESDTPFDGGARLSNLAYVIYTSGSTGTPKGVQVPHGALVNFLESMRLRPGFTAEDSLLAVTTLSFDIAGLELYLPLLAGGRLVLATRDEAQAGERLIEILGRSAITVMQATPATWRLLLGGEWKGKPDLKVLCGGEALPRDLADNLLDKVGELWNVYGPTEATIWSTLDRLAKSAADARPGPVSIGLPLANTQVHLLTERHLQPVPMGVPGELMIGGLGLARGYRGLPKMTAERFIPDPFAEQPGARLYRTGDLSRRLPDGRLDFLGRLDHQVKVRGYRIELGEIEAALAAHPHVAQAVTLAREDSPGQKRLVGYVVPIAGRTAPEAAELKSWLKDRLTEYMVPAFFVPLEAFPLTPNGKVDRRSLPAPDPAASRAVYVAPRDAQEEKLAEIWGEVLKLERVGVHDDFFDLGGDSLLVVRVVSKAAKVGITLTTKLAFQHRTVAELSAAAGSVNIIAEQGPVVGLHKWTPAQLQFQDLKHPNPHFHSTGTLLEPREGGVSTVAIRETVKVMLKHHDTLRVRMPRDEQGRAHLWIDPPGRPPAVMHCDLTSLPEEQHIPVMTRVARRVVVAYDLEKGPLFKGLVFELEKGRPQYLFLTAHFYPVDLGSWVPLLDDFDTAYRQIVAGEPVELQPKTTSAADWANRLHERAEPGVMPDDERRYWLKQAPENPTRVPLDLDEGPNDWPAARVERHLLEPADTEILLSHAPRAFGVQIDGILVTALLEAFAEITGERSLPFILLGHGREPLYDDMDISRTVGWFNTLFPVEVSLGDDERFTLEARHVNQQLRAVPNGGIGYGLLKFLSTDADSQQVRSAPWPQVHFNYNGPDNAKELRAFKKLQNFGGYHLDTYTQRLCPLVLTSLIEEDALLTKWEWSVNRHQEETVKKLVARYDEVLRWFVDEYRRRQAAVEEVS